MFSTASLDSMLRLWDANYLDKEAVLFELGYGINSHAFGQNSMIAVGTTGHHVRLCDMRTGGSSHALKGHRAAVYDVAWNPSNEYQLASCGADKCVKVFDIRKSTALFSCDDAAWGLEYSNLGIVVVRPDGIGINRFDLSGSGLHLPGRGLRGASPFTGVVKPVVDEGYIVWPEGKYVKVWRGGKTRAVKLEGHYRDVKSVGVRPGVGRRFVSFVLN
jgi:hypothetical protein